MSNNNQKQQPMTRRLLSFDKNWTVVTYPPLKVSTSGMAAGYYENNILLIGGEDSHSQKYSYNILKNEFAHVGSLSNGVSYGNGQFYTQQDNKLYMIRGYDIAMYNLLNNEYIPSWNNIPNITETPGCLASTSHYIFYFGRNESHVLNITSKTWLPNPPRDQPLQSRWWPSCVIHPPTFELYVIGGKERDDMIKMDIQSQIWSETIENVLQYSVHGARSIIIEDNIWVIGGYDEKLLTFSNAIQIIDITTNTSSIGPYLGYGVFSAGIIKVNNIIYAFGGKTSICCTQHQNNVDTWQYIDLGTDTPTINPTMEPITIFPATSPTIDPTYITSTELTIDFTQNPKGKDATNAVKSLEFVFQRTLFIFIGLFICIAIIGFIDAKCFRINDFYHISCIGQATIQVLDMLSDCFLSVEISLQTNNTFKIALVISIIFIVIPALLSLFQVYYYSRKHWSNDNQIREWLLKYSKMLYLVTIFTGSSFTAIDIMNSNILGLYFFEMGLNNKQIISFKTQRIYSVVMFENIPQLALQIWYMITIGQTNVIAMASTIFSGISIIVTILSMTMEKSLINSQQYTKITMNISSGSVVKQSRKCKRVVKSIKQGIASLIGLDNHIIDVLKPITIPNGLRLEIHLYIDNQQSKDRKYDDLFQEIIQNGSLGQLIFESWKLESVPAILSLKCEHIKSHEMTTDKMMSQNMQSDKSQIVSMVPVANTTGNAK
eukprot:458490_1